MTVQVGLDAKLYHDPAGVAGGAWVEVPEARDVTLSMEGATADASSRASEWRAFLMALLDAELTVEMVYDTDSTVFMAFLDAFFARSALGIFVADGEAATVGTEGFQADFHVSGAEDSEPLEDTRMFTFTLKPAKTATAPAWVEITV